MFTYTLYEIRFIPEGWEPSEDLHTESNDPEYRPGEVRRAIILKTPTGADPEARLRHLASVCQDASTIVKNHGQIHANLQPDFFWFLELNTPVQECILDIIGDVL